MIDLNVCVGCHACVTSCKEWNTSGSAGPLVDENAYGANPTGTFFNRVQSFEAGSFPDTDTIHFPKSCLHCEEPPCVPVCPTGASYKRKEDGIVLVDYDKCIGCKYCAWACPYGAREIDEARQVMTKCTLCVDRIYDESMAPQDRRPACVKACPTGARLFGDVKDPDSEVSRAIRERGGYSLMPEWDTKPANQYLPRRSPRRRRPARERRDLGEPGGGDEPGVLGRSSSRPSPVRRRASSSRSRSPPSAAWRARGSRRACSLLAAALLRGRPRRVVPAPRPPRARLARGGDVAQLVAVARGDRAAGVHRRRRPLVGRFARLAGAVDAGRLPLAAIAVAPLLWVCTAMIYACLRFIEEWAHPLTLVNFLLTGLASGFALAAAAGALAGERLRRQRRRGGVAFTLVAWAARALALRRNAGLRHRSTLQSATGIAAPRLVQTSMGMSAGSFNTREFFHHASLAALRTSGSPWSCSASSCRRCSPPSPSSPAVRGVGARRGRAGAGLLADRWTFFAQAKHPQNLYYQVVS